MLENLGYKLTITQEGPQADKNFKNVIVCDNHAQALEKLACCFRDLNRTERALAIKSARHWVRDMYDSKKRADCFTIRYDVHSDHSIITVYNYEFTGAL